MNRAPEMPPGDHQSTTAHPAVLQTRSIQRRLVWWVLAGSCCGVVTACLVFDFDGRFLQTAACAVGAAFLSRPRGAYRWLAAGNACMALGLLPLAWKIDITTIGQGTIYPHTILMFGGDLLWIVGLTRLPGRQKTAWDGWLLVGSVLVVSCAYQIMFILEEGHARWDGLLFSLLFMAMFLCGAPAWQTLLAGRAPRGRLLVFMGLLLLWMNNFAYWIADVYGLYPEDPILLSFALGFALINAGWIGESATMPIGGTRTMLIGAAAIMVVSYASIWTFRQARDMTLASWLILDGYTITMALLVFVQSHAAQIRLVETRFRKYTALLDDMLHLDSNEQIMHLEQLQARLLARLQDIFPELAGYRLVDVNGTMPDHLAGRRTEHVLAWPGDTQPPQTFSLELYCTDDVHVASTELKILAPLLARRLHQLLIHVHQQVAARTDPLTGLLNRRGAQILIPDLVLRCMRDHIPLAVVLVDIDHFKSINDTFGHHAGDGVILAMARAIMAQTRQLDCAVRWGGEEFLILLHGCDLLGAHQTTQRILSTFREKAIESIHDGRIVTASAGISGGRMPAHTQEIDQWIQAADVLLYEAKSTGRDRIVSQNP